MDALLVEVVRGGRVESRHVGSAVVVDAQGRVLFAAGSIEAPVYTRSTVKALPSCQRTPGMAATAGLSGARSMASTWAPSLASAHVQPPGAAPRSMQDCPGFGQSPIRTQASQNLR